jgi:hypothetical protein
MFVITLLYALVGFLLAPLHVIQDTVAHADTTVVQHTGIGIGGVLVGYVFQYLIPLLTAWLVKIYNTKALSWYAQLSDFAKRAVYVAVTVLAMYAVQIIGIGWDKTWDVSNLPVDFFSKVIVALVSTLQVALGIKTAREKGTT